MLIKASKSTLLFFKQHFCENPSKLANLADFVSQKKKDVIFSNISEVKISREKKMSDFCDANFDPMDLFFLFTFFPYYLWGVK